MLFRIIITFILVISWSAATRFVRPTTISNADYEWNPQWNRQILNIMEAIPEDILDKIVNIGPIAFKQSEILESVEMVDGMEEFSDIDFMIAFFNFLVNARISLPNSKPEQILEWTRDFAFDELSSLATKYIQHRV